MLQAEIWRATAFLCDVLKPEEHVLEPEEQVLMLIDSLKTLLSSTTLVLDLLTAPSHAQIRVFRDQRVKMSELDERDPMRCDRILSRTTRGGGNL
jgi:hypothetical protein